MIPPRPHIPKSVSQGQLDLGDFIIHFHVLDNGRKVVEADDVEEFTRRLFNGTLNLTRDQMLEIGEFIKELS